MVLCDVQRWNMQKQIDATRYIVPYKTDDRMSIIVLRYMRRRMRIVSQGRLTLWRHSALRCDVTPRYAVTWLFTRKTPSYKTYTCQKIIVIHLSLILGSENWSVRRHSSADKKPHHFRSSCNQGYIARYSYNRWAQFCCWMNPHRHHCINT